MRFFILAGLVAIFFGACCNESRSRKTQITVEFDSFAEHDLDYGILIRTKKNDLLVHIDTLPLFTHNSTVLRIDPSKGSNFDYIIKNENPFLEHHITQIQFLSTGMNRCKQNTHETKFFLDSTSFLVDDPNPRILKK